MIGIECKGVSEEAGAERRHERGCHSMRFRRTAGEGSFCTSFGCSKSRGSFCIVLTLVFIDTSIQQGTFSTYRFAKALQPPCISRKHPGFSFGAGDVQAIKKNKCWNYNSRGLFRVKSPDILLSYTIPNHARARCVLHQPPSISGNFWAIWSLREGVTSA